jgi:two-component system chemotaxis response regulator CheY
MQIPATLPGLGGSVAPTRHILYADDMPDLRRLLEMTLGRDGHTVATVPDGRAALDLITAAPAAFDLLITDHHMPVMNGLELVGRLRQLQFAGRIIIFSAALSAEVSAAYRRLRVDYILPKPIFPDTLRALLATL